MKKLLTLFILFSTIGTANAFDINTYTSPEFYRHYGKQQIKTKDSKGNTIYITPHYNSYEDRNSNASEKQQYMTSVVQRLGTGMCYIPQQDIMQDITEYYNQVQMGMATHLSQTVAQIVRHLVSIPLKRQNIITTLNGIKSDLALSLLI